MIKIVNSIETIDKKKFSTLRFTLKDLKPKISKAIKAEGMYGFEKVFGESNGHGCGLGCEDISFTIPKQKGCKELEFWMENNGKEIKVIERLNLYSPKHPYEFYDSKMIDISPELQKFLKRTILAR